MTKSPQAKKRALNLLIAPELKDQVERLALRRGYTMAQVVRRALELSLPLLDVVWNAEERAINDQSGELLAPAVEIADSADDYGDEKHGNGPVR